MEQLGILSVPEGQWKKVENTPYMPLTIERHGDVVYLSHTSVMNGDLMSDPLMTFRIDDEMKVAAPLTFQNDWTGTYQEVWGYTETGQKGKRVRLERDLISFAVDWLRNLRDQGFGKVIPTSPLK
jgi:hypothetical protein